MKKLEQIHRRGIPPCATDELLKLACVALRDRLLSVNQIEGVLVRQVEAEAHFLCELCHGLGIEAHRLEEMLPLPGVLPHVMVRLRHGAPPPPLVQSRPPSGGLSLQTERC